MLEGCDNCEKESWVAHVVALVFSQRCQNRNAFSNRGLHLSSLLVCFAADCWCSTTLHPLQDMRKNRLRQLFSHCKSNSCSHVDQLICEALPEKSFTLRASSDSAKQIDWSSVATDGAALPRALHLYSPARCTITVSLRSDLWCRAR
eukprot:SAG31_NODE_1593_length_7811_cov_13.037215_5_plen_147_part_00